MNRRPEPESIPLSYLNALEYCPRRFYYEFVEGDMLVNEFVLEGTLLHQRADEPGEHQHNGETQINRVYLNNERLRIAGFADIVEEHDGLFIPVEYKHGKEGKWLNDHIQLCAQALCLEERIPDLPAIPHGYIFYFGKLSNQRLLLQRHNRRQAQPTLQQKIQRMTDLIRQIAELPPLEETPPTLITGDTGIHGTQLETLLLQYPLTDRRNEENLTPLPTSPDAGHSNRIIPNRSSGFALGLEGAGSAIYFSCFHNLLTDQQQWSFSGRVKRPPTDPVNALLSYGYAILSSQVSSAVQIVGFDPYVGYLHSSAYGRPALALDLMEEFRPLIVDSVVITLLNNRMLTPNDFHIELGAYRLKKEPKKLFLTRFEERLNEEVTHPIFGYKTKYRHCIELQARLMAKHITGDIDEYPPFIMR